MKLDDITPGLYRVKPEKKRDGEMVYKIAANAQTGTRFRDFKHKSGWGLDTNARALHIRAFKVDVRTQKQDPWAVCIKVSNILAPFHFPKIEKSA